jgi:hypothetical protein
MVVLASALAVLTSIFGGPMLAHAGTGSLHCGTLVYGMIEDRYVAMNGESGPLGCPLGMEDNDARGGRWEAFQNGFVFYNPDPNIGTHAVYGAIANKWTEMGRENGVLGYPVTDEIGTPDGVGRYNHFERSGSIYWTPSTGAHAIYGQIRDKWASLGWEQAFLGYPTSDETGTPDGSGRFNTFQHGKINWTQAGGPKLEFSSLSFDWPDFGLSSVSGFAHLTVYSNGSYDFTGHVHDGGFWAYNVSVGWGLRANDGTLFQFLDTGHVQGTLGAGSRDHDWNATGTNAALAQAWPQIEEGFGQVAKARSDWDVARIFSDIKSAFSWVGTIVDVVKKL